MINEIYDWEQKCYPVLMRSWTSSFPSSPFLFLLQSDRQIAREKDAVNFIKEKIENQHMQIVDLVDTTNRLRW